MGDIFQDTADLAKELNKVFIVKNTIPIKEFKKYEKLFRPIDGEFKDLPPEVRSEYLDLSKEYSQRINMYHPVNIVNDKGEVVLVLPALFIPLRPLSNNETNKAARNKFTMLGHSDIPKYASDATHGLFTAIINEQGNNGNRVAVATEEFR